MRSADSAGDSRVISSTASSGENRNSARRISPSSPCDLIRSIGNFGSRRDIRTTRNQAGRLRTKRDTDSSTKLIDVHQVEVVDDEHRRRSILGLQIGDQLVHRARPGWPGRRSIASARSPHPGANVSRAAITPDQNWTPSQSVSSSDNHAVGVDDSATHPATSDVFPVPAGATTSVSRLRTTSSKRSSRRERRM